MSAGRFTSSIYQTDAGNNVPCAVQPETLLAVIGTVTNAPAAEAEVLPGWPSANMRGGRSQNGITARKIRIGLPEGNAEPTGYSGDPIYLPVLTTAAFTAATKGAAVTYLGATWEVLSRVPEYIN